MRQRVALYRDPAFDPAVAAAARGDAMQDSDDEDDDGTDGLEVREHVRHVRIGCSWRHACYSAQLSRG